MSPAFKTLRPQAVSTFTTQGRRMAQEDFVLVDREKCVFVVADGFGGPIPGANASKTACEAVKSFLFKEIGDRDATLPFVLRTYFSLAGNVLFNSLIHANRKLMSYNRGKGVHEKGGASVIAGFIDGDLLAIANVGLCSAWLLRQGQAIELVLPRSFAKLCNPFVTSDTASEWKVPLMALGVSDDLEPEIFEYRVQEGDWLVFQSDGISHSMLEKIVELQKKINQTVEESIQAVTTSLNTCQFEDNAALILVIF